MGRDQSTDTYFFFLRTAMKDALVFAKIEYLFTKDIHKQRAMNNGGMSANQIGGPSIEEKWTTSNPA